MLIPVSEQLLFAGRPGDLRLGQWVQTELPGPAAQATPHTVIFGCPDDTGVVLNRGRGGASQGPQEIRRAFYKMTLPMNTHWNDFQLVDAGDIDVTSDILKTHQQAFEASKMLTQIAHTVIVLGGGHDFAAPAFSGFMDGCLERNRQETFALINIDPHLDVRELESGKPHSGTPFRQLLERQVLQPQRFVEFGCRENRNSLVHYEYCQSLGVRLLPLEHLRSQAVPTAQVFQNQLNTLARESNTIGITLDMDSCYEVTGTSAAPAVGFSIRELFEMALAAGRERKVRYFEIAEVAPNLDPSGKTALAAAEILYGFLSGRVEAHKIHNSSPKKLKVKKTAKTGKKR
ncbi:MAG: hypothetical protein EB078_10305 [Proteobacteria bacterium]|nr:hypothetical protein [Pseudomonadota bacterium]NDD05287.1 hypothetical protein [Pseudomonadota bacterium]